MRTSAQFDDLRVARVLYSSYVRNNIELAAIVWDPDDDKIIQSNDRESST